MRSTKSDPKLSALLSLVTNARDHHGAEGRHFRVHKALRMPASIEEFNKAECMQFHGHGDLPAAAVTRTRRT